MKLWGMRKKEDNGKADDGKRLVASISDNVASSIFREMLKDNGIAFICSQPGAGGYIKILTGGLLVSDNIYVDKADYEKASELYKAYFEEGQNEDFNGE